MREIKVGDKVFVLSNDVPGEFTARGVVTAITEQSVVVKGITEEFLYTFANNDFIIDAPLVLTTPKQTKKVMSGFTPPNAPAFDYSWMTLTKARQMYPSDRSENELRIACRKGVIHSRKNDKGHWEVELSSFLIHTGYTHLIVGARPDTEDPVLRTMPSCDGTKFPQTYKNELTLDEATTIFVCDPITNKKVLGPTNEDGLPIYMSTFFRTDGMLKGGAYKIDYMTNGDIVRQIGNINNRRHNSFDKDGPILAALIKVGVERELPELTDSWPPQNKKQSVRINEILKARDEAHSRTKLRTITSQL